MPEFLQLSSPVEAIEILLRTLPERVSSSEIIATSQALGRVTIGEVRSPHPMPEFPRSTMDGYAVRASDTFGVSESMPGYLSLIGEVLMGMPPSFELTPGKCAMIHTGGMLPGGADAVVMLEHTQRIENHAAERTGLAEISAAEIEISRAVATGENINIEGEDVSANQLIFPAGTLIRPPEIGGCMALGINQLRVANKPLVGILSSGDEVVPPEIHPLPGQVRDVNSNLLSALVREAGGVPELFGVIPDKLTMLKNSTTKALAECDIVVISAGSSASSRDMTAEVIGSLGSPGVLVHGINIRPGKPTILAVCDGKAVIGLPGNPVSAFIIARLILVPVIEKLLGVKVKPKPTINADLTINIASQAGREDWVAVKLISSPFPHNRNTAAGEQISEKWLAEPIFGKSNLIFTLVAADGLIRIPSDATGLGAGEKVEVYPL